MWLVDADGRRYLDFTAGIGVTSTGPLPPRGWWRRRRARPASCSSSGRARDGAAPGAPRPWPRTPRRTAGPGHRSVFTANSGAEAVEAAVRLRRAQATGRHRRRGVPGWRSSGRTDGAVADVHVEARRSAPGCSPVGRRMAVVAGFPTGPRDGRRGRRRRVRPRVPSIAPVGHPDHGAEARDGGDRRRARCSA
ncbi:MAG: hypothetical protein U5R31_07040 [Acidimicrobiia bacterium]|nr:hypothetical protein [Acidimicrobiia bacterium]